jgi:hypothetical protein
MSSCRWGGWYAHHPVLKIGTEGRTRTDTVSPPPDFESGASTSSATPAQGAYYNDTLLELTMQSLLRSRYEEV